MKPLTTNSTGNTLHFFMMATFGSGVDRRALDTMWSVWPNHQAAVWFRTWGWTLGAKWVVGV